MITAPTRFAGANPLTKCVNRPCCVLLFHQVTDEQFAHRMNRFPRDPPATKEVSLSGMLLLLFYFFVIIVSFAVRKLQYWYVF